MKKLSALILLIMVMGSPSYALDFKKIWKCRPGAKSNRECTQEERKTSRNWFIGGAVTTATITAGAALGIGAAGKKYKDKEQEGEDIIGTLNKWYELAQKEKYEQLNNEIRKNNEIWNIIKANVEQLRFTDDQQEKVETIKKAIGGTAAAIGVAGKKADSDSLSFLTKRQPSSKTSKTTSSHKTDSNPLSFLTQRQPSQKSKSKAKRKD